MSLTCKGFDLIIVIGSLLSRDNTHTVEKMQTCMNEGAKLIYLHTMEDAIFTPKSHFFSRYEVGSEEGVLALLAKALLLHVNLPTSLQAYFEGLDDGYLSAESNLGEEEIEEIQALYATSKGALIWLGEDVLKHPRFENCVRLAKTIAAHTHAVVYGVDETVENGSVLEEVASLKSYDGTIVYQCLKKENESAVLIGSAQFAIAAKATHGMALNVALNQEVYACTFVQDDSLKGTIALMPRENVGQEYPYRVAKIVKADVQ